MARLPTSTRSSLPYALDLTAPLTTAGCRLLALPAREDRRFQRLMLVLPYVPQRFLCYDMAVREMKIVIDNSRNITVNSINIEALNAVQMPANLQVDRAKFEAAQALGSAEAMFQRMSESHEQEPAAWYKSAARMGKVGCQAQRSQAFSGKGRTSRSGRRRCL